MDQLEKFIHQNRDQFDDHSPDPALWSAIEAQLPRPEMRRLAIWKWVAAAAVGLVLLLSGVIAGMSIGGSDFQESAEYQEFQEAEQYYSGQFNHRLMQLATYEYDPEIDKDIQEMSSIYEELTIELLEGAHADQNQVIEALIQNYQMRLDLLERVLLRLDEGKQRMQKTEEDEPTKI